MAQIGGAVLNSGPFNPNTEMEPLQPQSAVVGQAYSRQFRPLETVLAQDANTGLVSPVNRQAGKPALRQCAFRLEIRVQGNASKR